MPEIPDLVVHERYVERTSLHQPIAGVEVRDAILLGDGTSPDGLDAALTGQAFEATHRHGKHLFVQYANPGWLALHFGMTGTPCYYANGDHPDYSHVRIYLENGHCLALVCPRKFARVRLIDDPAAFVDAKNLGPDVRRVDFETFCERFDGRRGTIKGALLDQSLLAGLGNIYADEVLYQVGVHPRTKAKHLDGDTLRAMYDAMHRIIDAAVAADADPTAMPPERFMLPHRYSDERCPETGVPLHTETVSGRTAYFSPVRQPRPSDV